MQKIATVMEIDWILKQVKQLTIDFQNVAPLSDSDYENLIEKCRDVLKQSKNHPFCKQMMVAVQTYMDEFHCIENDK